MSTPTDRVIADLQVRQMRITPPPADGTGHPEWYEELLRERSAHRAIHAEGHHPTWADYLRLNVVAALAATDTTTLRRELLDAAGVILGWVADLDARARQASA